MLCCSIGVSLICSNKEIYYYYYNVDLLKINSIQAHEEYFDNISSLRYVPTVTLPTQLSNNSSLIDNVFTKNLSPDFFSCISDVHISDHQPVILFSDKDLPEIRVKYITIKLSLKKLENNSIMNI